MSVTIRPYRSGGWEIDIRVVTPDGARDLRDDGQPLTRQMVQYRVLRASRRAKWSQDRVHILRHHAARGITVTPSARTWRCVARRRGRSRSSPGTRT